MVSAVLSVMTAHAGAGSVTIASKGCDALASLVAGNTVNADAVVLGAGGLCLVLALMETHILNENVQKYAGGALLMLSRFGSPATVAALRESRVAELLTAAVRTHPQHASLKRYADGVLAAISATEILVAD